jgi:ubiquinone/menaquinone biosynthesis C-methylase UbiE
MEYALESDAEFERLERQSTYPKYDYRSELAGIVVGARARILDAGCGSGVVSRYLARHHADCTVVGCDESEDRIARAAELARDLPNLRFRQGDICAMSFAASSFDLIFCRYVLQHCLRQVR